MYISSAKSVVSYTVCNDNDRLLDALVAVNSGLKSHRMLSGVFSNAVRYT
jgi:hypothetical protein